MYGWQLMTHPSCVSKVGPQYAQKPSEFSLSKSQAAAAEQAVDDIGVDASKRGKRWFPFSDGPRNCVGQVSTCTVCFNEPL